MGRGLVGAQCGQQNTDRGQWSEQVADIHSTTHQFMDESVCVSAGGPLEVAGGAELHALLSPWAFAWMGFPTVSRGSPAGCVVGGLAAELLAERGASALWASVSSFVNWELQPPLLGPHHQGLAGGVLVQGMGPWGPA